MSDRPWTRDEVLLTIRLYCKLPYRKLRQSTPEVRDLASLLNRTPSAISKRCCNYVQFDPVESQRVKGFTRAAKLDKLVWSEVSADWETFAMEAERLEHIARKRRLTEPVEETDVLRTGDSPFPIGAERERQACDRIGQRFFREAILTAYDHRCCVTGIAHDALLVASHIKPWKVSDPATERTNPHNGLCLSPLYDRAFDAGLMTVDEDYRIVFSSAVLRSVPEEIAHQYFHRHHGRELALPDRFSPEQRFLRYHRDSVFIP
ncbi:MAG: HNH endonuclease [Rhodoferax sp.]